MSRWNLIASILIVFALAAAFAWAGLRQAPGQPGQPAACTEEALLCPDGSGVGRSGPECKFKACPNKDSFVGKLVQQGSEFRLIIPTPASMPGATYALPVEFKVSNVVGQLLNQTVRVKGSFAEGNIYKADELEELTPEEAGAQNVVTVGVGETMTANGLKITLNKVVQDSRCPVDVQCIEAGAITANVTLRSDTDRETFNMPSDEVPRGFDTFKVSIVNVSPSRVSKQDPAPDSYEVTFKVEPLK